MYFSNVHNKDIEHTKCLSAVKKEALRYYNYSLMKLHIFQPDDAVHKLYYL